MNKYKILVDCNHIWIYADNFSETDDGGLIFKRFNITLKIVAFFKKWDYVILVDDET
jgi:hypothetical protein